MAKNHMGRSGENEWMGDYGKYGSNVENHKRRQALPAYPVGRPIPSLAGEAKFFARLTTFHKMEEFVFITKAIAKNR